MGIEIINPHPTLTTTLVDKTFEQNAHNNG